VISSTSEIEKNNRVIFSCQKGIVSCSKGKSRSSGSQDWRSRSDSCNLKTNFKWVLSESNKTWSSTGWDKLTVQTILQLL